MSGGKLYEKTSKDLLRLYAAECVSGYPETHRDRPTDGRQYKNAPGFRGV